MKWGGMNQLADPFLPCETWSLALQVYPSHSRLYALEPCGLGTPQVESLTSYVARLAEAHSVSLRTLAIQELLPLLKRDYLSSPFKNTLSAFLKEAARAVNGIGLLAHDWVQIVEQLTFRSDLSALTLLPWAAVLTSQRLLRLTRAWCPACFMEWQAAGQPIYEPLLWNISVVSVCVVHQRTLLRQCPYPDCQAILPLLASQVTAGYCSKCWRWLGVTMDPSPVPWTTQQWNWQIWIAQAAGDLVANNLNLSVSPHRSHIPDLITSYREEKICSLQDLAESLQLARRTLNAWQLGKQVPQLESLMRLCYCCGVSPYGLLTMQRERFGLGKLTIRSLPDETNSSKRSRSRFDDAGIRQALESALVSEEQPPPSMRSIAKRLKYSPKELREHFPELSRAISDRYKSYQKVRGEKNLDQKKENIRQAILEIHSRGYYPSYEKVISYLKEPSWMRNLIAWECWREIMRELKLVD